MLKILSGLDEDQLGYFLNRIREIAAHDDEAALIETDKFVWEIIQGEAEGAWEGDLAETPATQPDAEAVEGHDEEAARQYRAAQESYGGK